MTTPSPASAKDSSFVKSLNVLKEIFMIDSPTRQLLDSDIQQRRYEESKESKKIIDQQREQIADLEAKLKKASAQAEKETALRGSLEKAFDDLVTARKESNRLLDDSERSKEPLRLEIETLKEKVEKQGSTLGAESSKLAKKILDTNEEKQQALKSKDFVEARLVGAERLVEELKAKIKSQEESFQKEKRRLEDLNEEVVAGNTAMLLSLKSADDTKMKMARELSETKEKYKEAEKQRATTNEQLQQNVQAMMQVAEKEDMFDSSDDDDDDDNNESNANELRRLADALDETTQENEDLATELEQSKAKLAQVESENAKSTEKLQHELQTKMKLLESSQKLVKLLQENKSSMEKQAEVLRAELEQAKSGPSAANDESLKEELENVKDELECAENEVKRQRARVQELEQERKESAAAMSAALDQAQAEIESLQAQLAERKRSAPEPEESYSVEEVEAEVVEEPYFKRSRKTDSEADDDDEGNESRDESIDEI